MAGILAKKIGMTQVFNAEGKCIAVTVLKADPAVVTQLKTLERDGYEAIQLGFEETEYRRLNKAEAGHLKKSKLKAYKTLKEFRVDIKDFQIGSVVSINRFQDGDMVNVTGVSKGKGFQGVIKRHHKSGGPKTHGSTFHRSTGSIGQRTYPGKVFKNMKLPGQMGNKQVTVKNLRVLQVRPSENLLLIEGPIPGANQSLVLINNNHKDFLSRKELSA